MKKTFLLLILVLPFFVRSAEAQWIPKISGTGNDLYDLHFPSSATGYAVGAAGTVIKTTDAGETWNALVINTTEDLHAVHFTDEATGFVAGDVHAFKTVDGGNLWAALTLPAGYSFRDLLFLDSQTGFCIGGDGLIFKTTDGGTTWVPKTPVTLRIMSSIHFPMPQIGYAVGTGYGWAYLKTTDGGETWTESPINTPIPNLSNLEAVFFTAPDKGFIGGWYISAFVATSNGGSNWISLDDSSEPQLYAIHFPTETHGYAVGWHGRILNSTDSGNTWSQQIYGDGSSLYAVQFTDEITGYIVGDNGLILKTGNGGVTVQSEVDTPAASIKVYPNPTTGAVLVDLSAYANRAIRMEVYDVQGSRLKVQELEAAGNSVETLDLSTWPSGVYYIRVQLEGLPDVVKKVVALRD
ncbi:MAG: YCF48-related protein [Saprospiraceae bacterium]|nr:YCF48-related protein [Saprospiraceae bacterium]MDZ4704076.1 YCF48-related protein [Saprospiraceae bacterium]